MQRGTSTMDRELPVKLTATEIQERGESMAAKMVRVKTLRKKRRDDLRAINAQIEAELDTVQSIAETIMSGIEARKQGDLFVGDQVVGADPNVPTTEESAQALAKVAETAGESPAVFHKDGKICRKDPCKKRHLTALQCRTNEIVPEGDEIGSVPQSEAPAAETNEASGETSAPAGETESAEGETIAPSSACIGCGKDLAELSAMERAKKICEECQLAKPADVPLEEEAAAVASIVGGVLQDVIEADDPRPRCQNGGELLTALEVLAGHGACQNSIDTGSCAGAEGEQASA